MKLLKEHFKKLIKKQLIIASLLAYSGCLTSDSVSIVFSGSSNIDIANLTIQESTKIPILAYRNGPYFYARTIKNFEGMVGFSGCCYITNSTSALGMCNSQEEKTMNFVGFISPSTTNISDLCDMVSQQTNRNHVVLKT